MYLIPLSILVVLINLCNRYFSMDSSGSIHEFADSQFGHLFASGTDRESARRNMASALKELSIRGDISTTVDYIGKLIELDDFVENRIDTGWLDRIIKEDGIKLVPSAATQRQPSGVGRLNLLGNDNFAVIGATVLAYDRCTGDETTFMELLERGQLPPLHLLQMVRDVELILQGVKYRLCCTRTGADEFQIAVAGAGDKCVTSSVRRLSDGGYLISSGGRSQVAYRTSAADAACLRLSVAGRTVAFSPDYDPTLLRTDVAGKLVRKLVPDGTRLEKGSEYAEIEVMKMFMPLKVEEAGIITWASNEGATLAPGNLLANLELENPDNVSAATIFEGDLEVAGWGSLEATPSIVGRPHITLRKALDKLKNGMAGYILSTDTIGRILVEISSAVTDPYLPALEIEEKLSVLNGRIDSALFDELSKMTNQFSGTSNFPAEKFKHLIAAHAGNIADNAERVSFVALTAPLVEVTEPYIKSRALRVPGAERVLLQFLDILREWISVERWFCDGISYNDAVDNMRKANKNNNNGILNICRAHAALKSTAAVILRIINSIAEAGKSDVASCGQTSVVLGAVSLVDTTPCLTDIASMRGNKTYDLVSQRCRNVLIEESLPSIEERKMKMLSAAKSLAIGSDDAHDQVQELINDNIVGSDILLPLLREAKDPKEQLALLEISVRKQHRTFEIKEVIPMTEQGTLKFAFCNKPKTSVFSRTAQMTSMTDLTRVMSSNKLSDMSTSDSENSLKSQELEETKIVKTGVIKICNTISDIEGHMKQLKSSLKTILAEFPQHDGSTTRNESGPTNVLSVMMLQDFPDSDQDSLAQSIEQVLACNMEDLEKADIRRVSFIISKDSRADNNSYPLPSVFTYREKADFKEDHLYRDIEPTASYQLEMQRIAKNFSLSSLGDHLSPSGQIYLYKATPKASALTQDKKANRAPRIFSRAVSFINEFSAGSFEQLLIEAFNSLESIKTSVPPGDNHLFINIVNASQSTVIDPVDVEQVVASILKRHSERISHLGIAEVETKAVCKLAKDDDSHPISLRLVASNPTGFVQVMNTYVEGESGVSKRVFKSIGGTKASMASSGDSSWDGLDVMTPYPLTRPFDAQRKAALKSSDTLYCYDLPALFEAAVEKQWSTVSAVGAQPTMVMFTSELVVKKKSGGPWKMSDYMNGDLELVETQRKAGKNDVGMVAWLMTLKSVECPQVCL